MTFGQILDAVCQDGISPTRRADAKNWVALRHAFIWGAAAWTFKQASAPIVFTANSQITSGPEDVHAVYSLYDSTGGAVRGIRDIRKFYDLYNPLVLSATGPPEAYTVVDGQLLVGPQGDGTTGLVVYQKEKPALVNDPDATGLPDGFDLALVHGAKAEGYALTNNPLAASLEASFQAAISALESDWTEAVLETGGQSGAFRPSVWPAWG